MAQEDHNTGAAQIHNQANNQSESQAAAQEAIQAAIVQYSGQVEALSAAIHEVVVGQEQMTSRLLIGLLTQGHVLLEGAPGLAKTLTVNVLARNLGLQMQRIQFTPDLLPSDLIGTMIYNQALGKFEVKKGPVFAHIILADEINRAPAKVQSALLEAMQERQVTIGDSTYQLDTPFLVLATQNPIEQTGTYPLPEAQLDRFMLRVCVQYPTEEMELEIMRRMSTPVAPSKAKPLIKRKEVFEIQSVIEKIIVSSSIERYIVGLVMATRNPQDYQLGSIAHYIRYGVSPRASIYLHRAAKAHAFLNKRDYVLPEDVKALAADVLAHRLILHYEADADNVTANELIAEILQKVPVHS